MCLHVYVHLSFYLLSLPPSPSLPLPLITIIRFTCLIFLISLLKVVNSSYHSKRVWRWETNDHMTIVFDHVIIMWSITGWEVRWPDIEGYRATDGLVQLVWWLAKEYTFLYCKEYYYYDVNYFTILFLLGVFQINPHPKSSSCEHWEN